MNNRLLSPVVKTLNDISDKVARRYLLTGRNPELSITRAYIVALTVIAILTVSGHVLTAYITNKQKEGMEVAYYIGQERALLQETALYASRYYGEGAKVDKDLLIQSLVQMRQGHEFLSKMIRDGGFLGQIRSPALYNLYYNHPFNIGQQIEAYMESAGKFAELPPEEDGADRKAVLDELMGKSSGLLVQSLDMALEQYQAEAFGKVTRYYRIQLWSALFILLILFVEAVFIFGPLVRQVGEYHRVLLREALEDLLTGLNNRRAFFKRTSTEIKRAERQGQIFAVVLTDLDKFKSINDTYGHEVGDITLKHFAAIMQDSLRAGDVTGRIGGEEFAIFLPATDADNAFLIIDRLRKRVEDSPVTYQDNAGRERQLNYTASFGIVTGSGKGRHIEDLLKRADVNLYAAKTQGRNRVIIGDAA